MSKLIEFIEAYSELDAEGLTERERLRDELEVEKMLREIIYEEREIVKKEEERKWQRKFWVVSAVAAAATAAAAGLTFAWRMGWLA